VTTYVSAVAIPAFFVVVCFLVSRDWARSLDAALEPYRRSRVVEWPWESLFTDEEKAA
jgi:hypothetical protein